MRREPGDLRIGEADLSRPPATSSATLTFEKDRHGATVARGGQNPKSERRLLGARPSQFKLSLGMPHPSRYGLPTMGRIVSSVTVSNFLAANGSACCDAPVGLLRNQLIPVKQLGSE